MDHQQQTKRRHRESNVIPFRLDAAFFFERAVRQLDRHDLQSALKYFRKAAEYEPDNPVNHCNLAGVLSELGSFEESNKILQEVLQSIDPHMHECYFYMANNWANLGDYTKAEEHAARYLELDPNGEFADDAHEMLDILIQEFGGGDVLRQRMEEKEEERREQDVARVLLEQGKFMEATSYLEKTIQQHPELIAPRNNLSLAYYYLGELDTAVEIAQEVLRIDASNLHARCNLAVFFQHQGKKKEVGKLIAGLKKVYPLNYDQSYKLATTMGILGEHETANRLFAQLVKWSPNPDPALLHCVAASACNIGNYGHAKRIWQNIQAMDPKSEIPAYYIRMIEEAEQAGGRVEPVSYQYQIPFHEQFKQMQEQLQTGKLGNWRNDPLIRSSLFWALQHGDLETKVQVIQTFALIADKEVERSLREFIRRPDEVDQLKQLAVYVLHHMGSEGPFEDMNDLQQDWKNVLDLAWTVLEPYGQELYDLTRQIWSDFLVRHIHTPPRIERINNWAAGLAYLVVRQRRLSLTQGEIAQRFGVSVSTVSRISRRIAQKLDS